LEFSLILFLFPTQARSYVGNTIGTKILDELHVGAAGEFLWYHQNPTSGTFSTTTYNWISSGLKGDGAVPEVGGDPFALRYISLMKRISYRLSKEQQAELNYAQERSGTHGLSFLNAWTAAYNRPPVDPDSALTVIDTIINIMIEEWSSNTSLSQIKLINANLEEVFNKAPLSGVGLFPLLTAYLNALGHGINISSELAHFEKLRKDAVKATEAAVAANGGLKLKNEDGGDYYAPRYSIRPTVAEISNYFEDPTASEFDLSMTAEYLNREEVSVSVSGSQAVRIPYAWFFGVSVKNDSSYAQNNIFVQHNSVTVSMKFSGVNYVSFAPAPFNPLIKRTNWFYSESILSAIRIGTADVTGYRFLNATDMDLNQFATGGEFGYVDGVAISLFPTISVTIKGSNYQKIATDIKSNSKVGIDFLGIPLATPATADAYSAKTKVNEASSSVTINFSPPDYLFGVGDLTQRRAYVLGATFSYPASTARPGSKALQVLLDSLVVEGK
jgi:hypothetical protein